MSPFETRNNCSATRLSGRLPPFIIWPRLEAVRKLVLSWSPNLLYPKSCLICSSSLIYLHLQPVHLGRVVPLGLKNRSRGRVCNNDNKDSGNDKGNNHNMIINSNNDKITTTTTTTTTTTSTTTTYNNNKRSIARASAGLVRLAHRAEAVLQDLHLVASTLKGMTHKMKSSQGDNTREWIPPLRG